MLNSLRPLSEILANRRWLCRLDPFPHVVADDVFLPVVAAELAQAFRQVLEHGERLTHFGWYDAYGYSFSHQERGPFQIFLSQSWHDLVASIAGVSVSGHVAGGLHHHAVASNDGFIHNDLNPVYFADDRSPNLADSGTVQIVRHDLVSYTNGTVHVPGTSARRLVRCVAVLYYLANDGWQDGDGGETGLYRSFSDSLGSPAVTVPPRNNSLLLFPCTPFSYHGYLANPGRERNSVVMWLHAEPSHAIRRWSEDALVTWVAGR